MSRPETDLAAALAADTPIPRDAEGPIFAEPWQAQAFALVVELQNKGVFTGPELWGRDADPSSTVSIEAWESYLEPA